jgi:type IV secretory pathway TraG/TraD family ATPase VirD4
VYKINYKAVVLAFILQMLAGAVWYASTPTTFLGRSVLEDVSKQPSIGMLLLFAFSVFAYLFFTAWLLVRVKGMSGLGRFFLVISIWLFIVLPNYVFIRMHLNLSQEDALYLLSYGAANCAIAAIILPLWRSSRSIFKD